MVGCFRKSRRDCRGEASAWTSARSPSFFQETEKHHGEYEPTAAKHNWSGWYAAYVVARERGRAPDEAAKEAQRHIEGGIAAHA
jgi:hypothetical protein